jgi:hypothetical protein
VQFHSEIDREETMAMRGSRAGGTALDRRSLLRGAALAGLGAFAAGCAGAHEPPDTAASGPMRSGRGGRRGPGEAAPAAGAGVPGAAAADDTVQMIFTAALIAEDLATTFYYQSLIGEVIQDPRLAGPEGSATNVSVLGSEGNVGYLRAALAEEISHADLMRQLIGRSDAAGDPVQTFYFPEGSFDDLGTFLSTLDALESAFVGAYLAAVRQLSAMAAHLPPVDAPQLDPKGNAYGSTQLIFFAEVAASILGVEAEHRALGRVIGKSIPANNLCYEQTAGIRTVYNGASSAMAALGPFVKPGAKGFGATGYALRTARAGSQQLVLPCTGSLPA